MADIITVTVNGIQISVSLPPADLPRFTSLMLERDKEQKYGQVIARAWEVLHQAHEAAMGDASFNVTDLALPEAVARVIRDVKLVSMVALDRLQDEVKRLELERERLIAEMGDMKREIGPKLGPSALSNRLARTRESVDTAYYGLTGGIQAGKPQQPVAIEMWFQKIYAALGSDVLNPITEAVNLIEAAHFQLVAGRSDEERPDVAEVGRYLDKIAVALGAEPPRDELNKETYGR